MIATVSKSEFRDAFHSMNRQDNFSYEGLGALYDYLVDLEEDCGTPFELDVIAICCDFCEFDDLDEVRESYYDIESLDDLRDNTTVIECDNGHIIIQSY